jgi:hypothetical protein
LKFCFWLLFSWKHVNSLKLSHKQRIHMISAQKNKKQNKKKEKKFYKIFF